MFGDPVNPDALVARVAVAALPVQEPDEPEASPVILPTNPALAVQAPLTLTPPAPVIPYPTGTSHP